MSRRFRILRAPADVQVWLAIPYPNEIWLDNPYPKERLPGTGRREIRVLVGTVAAPTWTEALDYATKGSAPRLLETVYPEWCGVA